MVDRQGADEITAIRSKVRFESVVFGYSPARRNLNGVTFEFPAGASVAFVGPSGFMEQRGYPHLVTAASRAYDESDQLRLWEVSEQLTGVQYSF